MKTQSEKWRGLLLFLLVPCIFTNCDDASEKSCDLGGACQTGEVCILGTCMDPGQCAENQTIDCWCTGLEQGTRICREGYWGACECDHETTCGNGICERGEDEDSCHRDCGCQIGDPNCTKNEVCMNGIDDDGDGATDCDDSDCENYSTCQTSTFTCYDDSTIPREYVCDGGCDCSYCEDEEGCDEFEICTNGIDDDGDGLFDCQDPDCFSALPCQNDITLIFVPSGTFQRDSSASNLSTVSGFRMSEYEVTRAQWVHIPAHRGHRFRSIVDSKTAHRGQ